MEELWLLWLFERRSQCCSFQWSGEGRGGGDIGGGAAVALVAVEW